MAEIYLGGIVHAPGRAGATALVTDQGAVCFVGSNEQARSYSGRIVPLNGRLVTPAFVDAHVHTIQTGQVMSGIKLGATHSVTEVLDAVADYATRHRAARVIIGQGWDEGPWPDPRPPLRTELDRAAPGRLVYLARVDVHSAVVSTSLLDELPGIDAEPGFSAAGWLTRDAHHRCRSRLDDLFSDAERRAAARLALGTAARQGIGTIHEQGGTHLCPLEDLTRVREVGTELGLDTVTYWGELASPDAVARARGVGAEGLAGDLCTDGAIGSRTAALSRPYEDADSLGFRYLEVDQIAAHVVACTLEGLQAGFHCIGDAAVAATIEGFRVAARQVGTAAIRAGRHRLEHLEMCGEVDIPVLAELGIMASMQPRFDAWWGGPGQLYETRLGRDRSTGMNRLGSLQRAGVGLALGSDSPVTPMAGWGAVRDAVQHWQPQERLSVAEALAAATIGGHRAARNDRGGILAPGAPATLTISDLHGADLVAGLPRLAADEPLPECVTTVVNGRTVFDVDDDLPVQSLAAG